jgi:hypothetical protein
VDPRVIEIFKNANDIQQSYVHARLLYDNNAQAAASLGIHRSTPTKWANIVELEEAISLLKLDKVNATQMAIQDSLLSAVWALRRAIEGKGSTASVAAARAILDRGGFPAMSAVDVTSGGEQVKATIYIPDNGRD